MKKNTTKSKTLNHINWNVAGIDIGASSIFVCIETKNKLKEVREFSTFTEDLRNMAMWLKENKIKSAAMESTGVYWIPVFDILAENKINPMLVNAHHIKNVPGRKTDVKDCEWIQQLHSYGLLNGSFRPDHETVQLRAYVRQRTKLIEMSSMQINLMHKVLAQMNVQLHQVISDVTGSTGMNIIKAIINGERNPSNLAKLRNFRCHEPEERIAKALEGNFKAELIFQLKQTVETYDFLQLKIIECEREISLKLNFFNPQDKDISNKDKQKKKSKNSFSFDIKQDLIKIAGIDITEVPGISENTAIKFFAEVGTDMSKWRTSKHFASWLGLCPNNKISGGKILSSKSKPSANRAAHALRFAANALHKSKTALGSFFRKKRIGLGTPKAITATAHKLAIILYNMLNKKTSFKDIGQEAYEQKYKERKLAALQKNAKAMGFELVPVSA